MIFDDIIGGFRTFLPTLMLLWFVFLAAFVGIVFGALPGLTAAAAIAMMLPILIVYNDELAVWQALAFLYVLENLDDTVGLLRAFYSTPPELQHLQQPCKTAIR